MALHYRITLSKCLFIIGSLCFICSCGLNEERWINGDKNNPTNVVVFKGNVVKMKLETIYTDGIIKEESEYEIDDRLINKHDKRRIIYILRAKTGRFSALPGYILNDTMMLDLNPIQAQLDTKEKLMHQLNLKVPVGLANIDSAECMYGLFGSAKRRGKVFVKTQ